MPTRCARGDIQPPVKLAQERRDPDHLVRGKTNDSQHEDLTVKMGQLLVSNGCDTFDGAGVLLVATPVVIAMATEISDVAASAFAARFCAAVASAQPIGPALRQGAVVLDLMGLDEGWKPSLLSRDDVAVDDLVLVHVPVV